MISCILLSAGLSQRFGSSKALAKFNSNQTIIRYLLEKLTSCLFLEIVVVLGHDKEAIMHDVFKHNLIHLVYNKDYKLGQTSSVIEGLKNCSKKSTGFLILPIDCPFVTPETIINLIKSFEESKPDILIPSYNERRGHPPIFNNKIKELILKMPLSQGINTLLNDPFNITLNITTSDPGVTQSFNTPEELKSILSYYNTK